MRTMATNDRRTRVPTGRYPERPELDAQMTATDDGTIECTIYPTEAPDGRRTTTWITAEEGSYVALDEVR